MIKTYEIEEEIWLVTEKYVPQYSVLGPAGSVCGNIMQTNDQWL